MFYAVKPISKAIVALVASTAPCFHHCSAFLMPLVSLRQFGANNSPLDAGGVLLPQRPGPAATRPFVRLRHDTYSIARFSPSNGARLVRGPLSMTAADGEHSEESAEQEAERSQQKPVDPRIYTVRISRAMGIGWGTDISFRWVYVRELDPSGPAANCGKISVGDQLCAIYDTPLAGAPFDAAMDALIGLQGDEVELTLFRGTQEELREFIDVKPPPETVKVTVLQKGKPDVTLEGPAGTNLRNILVDNGINVYQSVSRWTNCKGKQLCGTCIVDIKEGMDNTTTQSLDERNTLRENPESYRLSCVTDMYGDVTVSVFPPIGAAQWTR